MSQGFSFQSMQIRSKYRDFIRMNAATNDDPLLLRAARGEKVEKIPVWMMRQAGRHMKAYRDLCQTYKTFRERSEIAEVACEIRYNDNYIIFSNFFLT